MENSLHALPAACVNANRWLRGAPYGLQKRAWWLYAVFRAHALRGWKRAKQCCKGGAVCAKCQGSAARKVCSAYKRMA
jgi:hypothetical protein